MKPSRLAVVSVLLFGVAVAACGGRSKLRSGDGGFGSADAARDGRAGDGGVSDGAGGGGQTDVPLPGDGGTGGIGGGMLTGIGVTPALATAGIGTTRMFEAIGRFSDGTTRNLTLQATWSSATPAVASVMGGLATARAAGSTVITASLGSTSGTAVLTVTGAALTGLTIDPIDSTVPVGMRTMLQATGLYSDGSKQNLTSQVSWMSTEPAVASVSGGTVAGLRSGGATIVATFQNVAAKASVRVTGASITAIEISPSSPTLPVMGSQQFFATALFSDGTKGDVTGLVAWSSSDQAVLPISPQGFATAASPGSSVVTATLGNVAARTVVMVSRARLVAIRVLPPVASTPVGTTQAFQALGAFSDGTTGDVTGSVAWSAGNESVASVSNAPGSQGMATGLRAGGTVVVAMLSGVTGQARLTVTEAKVTGLSLSTVRIAVGVGTTFQVRAMATFSDGSQKDVTEATSWSVDDPAIASVSNAAGSAGLITGRSLGTTGVNGNYQGFSASGRVLVTGSMIVSIAIEPQMLSIPAGGRQTVSAIGTFADGTMVDVTTQVIWSTDNPMVATVSNAAGSNGQVTGVGEGQSTLIATLPSGVAAKALVVVTRVALDQLSVAPIAPSLRIGQSTLFGATVIRSNGTSQNVTLMTTWTSSNPMVASLGGGPLGASRATCNSVGTTTITATFMGLTDSSVLTCTAMRTLVEIQVTPFATSLLVGQMGQFQATAIYSDNTTQNVTGMTTWTSSNPMVAAVRNMGGMGGRGTVTGLSAGTATITGTYMGISASGFVTVTDATLTGLSVAPPTLALKVGETQGLVATAVFSDGTTRNVTGMTVWISSNQMVADVTNTAMGGGRGQVTALAAGTTTITATFMGFQATTAVTVTNPTLTAVQVSPVNATLPKGTMQQYQAVALYSDGSTRMVTGQAAWSSSMPGVAAVIVAGGARGQVTTLAMGTTEISATFGGVTGTTALTVTAATVTQVQVTPTNPTIPLNSTQPFQAVAIYSDFSAQNVTGQAGWSSTDTAVAQISNAGGGMRGQATGLSAGTTTINATFMGVTGSTTLTVTSASIKEIQVTPASVSSPAGVTISFTATAILTDNTSRNVTGMATWTSTDDAIVAISNAGGSRGLATALAAGAVTIRATVGSVSGVSTYTVGAQTLSSITVGPAMVTLAPGATSSFFATGNYSDGSSYEISNHVTWISTMSGVATVSNANGTRGLATGVAAGTTTIEAHFQGKTGTGALTVTP